MKLSTSAGEFFPVAFNFEDLGFLYSLFCQLPHIIKFCRLLHIICRKIGLCCCRFAPVGSAAFLYSLEILKDISESPTRSQCSYLVSKTSESLSNKTVPKANMVSSRKLKEVYILLRLSSIECWRGTYTGQPSKLDLKTLPKTLHKSLSKKKAVSKI